MAYCLTFSVSKLARLVECIWTVLPIASYIELLLGCRFRVRCYRCCDVWLSLTIPLDRWLCGRLRHTGTRCSCSEPAPCITSRKQLSERLTSFLATRCCSRAPPNQTFLARPRCRRCWRRGGFPRSPFTYSRTILASEAQIRHRGSLQYLELYDSSASI
jgi:hypothetical protein